jgi:hypothetical protein
MFHHQSNNAFQKNLPHIYPAIDFPKLHWIFYQGKNMVNTKIGCLYLYPILVLINPTSRIKRVEI